VVTLHIANRAFGGLRKLINIYKYRQIFNLAFKMNKLKQNIKTWLRANPKDYSFLLPYLLPYTNRYLK